MKKLSPPKSKNSRNAPSPLNGRSPKRVTIMPMSHPRFSNMAQLKPSNSASKFDPVSIVDQASEDDGDVSPRKLMAEFDPAPSHEIQKKFDFFYKPYSPKQVVSKYVRFGNEESEAL